MPITRDEFNRGITEEEQELNKKLVEWAGFRYGKFDFVSGLSSELNWVGTGWLSPLATSEPYSSDNFLAEAPSFTQSLDACFKWLVPKLRPEVIKIVPVTGVEKYGDYGCKWSCLITPAVWGNDISIIADKNSNPALALCLAIEKLIDSDSS